MKPGRLSSRNFARLAAVVIAGGIGLIAGGASALAMAHPHLWPFPHLVDWVLIAAGSALVIAGSIAVEKRARWKTAKRTLGLR